MQKGANREQYFVCGISLYKTASLMVSLQNRTSKTSVPLNIDVNKRICKMIILGLNVLPHNFMQSNLSTSRELSSKNHVQTACEFHCLNMVLVVRFVVLCHSQKLHGHVGIPVMRYERAARPCALNFRLAALKCRFGRPPNALSSVGVWPSMPPLCASFIQNVITLTGHLFIGHVKSVNLTTLSLGRLPKL